jgi:hypothetical protein
VPASSSLLIPVLPLNLMSSSLGFPSCSHFTEGWKTQPPIANGEWEKGTVSQKAVFSKSGKNSGAIHTTVVFSSLGHIPLADHGWEPDWKHQGVPAHRW